MLKSGTKLEDNSEIKNDYVINYGTTEMILLSNYKEWTLNSQLAVTDGIVLNVDSKNLSDGTWSGVIKHGDVTFDSEKNALYFDGDGDYLEITSGGDFSHGFAFEIYFNNIGGSGLFSRSNKIYSNNPADYRQTLRFMGNGSYLQGSFSYNIGTFEYTGLNAKTQNGYLLNFNTPSDLVVEGEDLFLTCIYRRYGDTSSEEIDSLDWNNEFDRVEIYLNGKLCGLTAYSPTTFDYGVADWGTGNCFVGLSNISGRLNYLNGYVYGCRLYTGVKKENGYYKLMSEKDVKSNYDATLQFRASGL